MQLVGQLCVHCQQRIPSELDGAFCALCGAPAHTKCVEKAIPPEGGCRVCGAPRAVVKALTSAARERERVAESTSQLQMAMVGVLLVVAGVLFSLLSVVFATGAGCFAVPIGALLTGLGMIIAGLRRRPRR